MTLTTRLVRVTLTDPDGAAVASASIRAELTAYEVDGSIIVPRLVYGQTDVDGTCLLHLWPNERGTAGSQYRITVVKSAALLLNTTATIPIGDPLTEVLLQTVINAAPYPSVNVAAQAVIDAQALVDTATTLKDQTQALHDVVVAMSTAINAVNADLANINAVGGDLTNVDLVAGSITSVNTVAASVADVNTVAGDIANINSVATDHANIDTVAGVHADVTTVAGIAGNVTTVAGVAANVTTVAGISSAVSTVAAANANISAVASDLTNLNAVATDLIALNAVAADLTALNAVNADLINLNNVVADLANIDTVAGDTTNINTVATNVANVNTVAGISANVTTVAGISANVTSVAGIAAAVTTNATNITAIQGAAANAAAVAADKLVVAADKATVAADKAIVIADMNTTAADRATTTAARDAAIAAWAASMSPAETLPAFAQSIHYGAVVKAILHIPQIHDSDGGAWTDRCSHTSWEREALVPGTWRQQRANLAACWAVSGAAAGDYYQNTTDGKFYQIGGTSGSPTQAEVFRGNGRKYKKGGIAWFAETGRVVGYDITVTGCPMWMVFNNGGAWPASCTILGPSGLTAVSSLDIRNGLLVVGVTSGYGGRLINFVSDAYPQMLNTTANNYVYRGFISARNGSSGYALGTSPTIVSATVNDVALTVLDTAPIDPATGLPVPTIFCGTAGGLSTITNAGTVTNSTSTTSVVSVAVKGKTLTSVRSDGTVCVYNDVTTMAVAPDKTYTASTIPATLGTASKVTVGKSKAVGSSTGVTVITDNPATPAAGMVATITNSWNSGHQIGNSVGAYLADTVAETITAASLVTGDSSNFAGGTVGSWITSTVYRTILAVDTGALVLTAIDAGGRAVLAISCVAGKTYVIEALGTHVQWSGGAYVGLSNSSDGSNATLTAASGVVNATLTATGTTIYAVLGTNGAGTAGAINSFDNISVKLAEPDRSVKGKGLVVNGSLTKAAVASGSGLVSYSGFSAANYLEQPYNSDLDLSAGGCVMQWVNLSSATSGFAGFYIGRAATAYYDIGFEISSGGLIDLLCSSNGTTWNKSSVAVSGVVPTTGWHLVAIVGTGSAFLLYVDGVYIAWTSGTNTGQFGWQGNTSDTLRIGIRPDGTSAAIGFAIALTRISATAPTADQIAQIYRDELPLFQANAQCTIGGSSTAVTALASDDVTDLLHVGTSIGRSEFKGLLRTNYEATLAGAITSLSANQGAVITGGTSGYFYQPAFLLRDELRRRDEARKALGKVPVFFDFTATASQTAFVLPKGYTAKALYKAGVLMRETTTGTYWSRSTDGYQETCTLSAGATVGDWVSVMAVRNY